ncbi:MAG: hypothetical protein JSS91_12505 [Bacteroidetes bacterium]|nr:hypothetical protein [Bacteroidota bacterium]
MRKLILLFCFVFLSSASFAQLVNENFSYPAGDSLTQHGWTAFSGAGFALFVTTPGLTFTGYPGSGVGNATTLTLTSASAQDAYVPFSINKSSGSVYASFMVRIDTATTDGNYFAAFLPSNSTSNYFGRVYARRAANGSIAFGVSKSSTNATILASYGDSVYTKGTTYVVVVKYKFNTGTTTDDEVSLFVFTAAVPAVEPAPYVGPVTTTQTDVAPDLGRFALRQGASGAALTPGCVVDGIRVTGAWNPAIWNFKMAIQGLFNGSTLNITDTVNIYVRNNISPYAVVDFATSTINSSTLTGNYEFDAVPNGTYYFEVKYRNTPIYRNGITTWSKAGGEVLTRTPGSYDFTTSAAKAFGSNQIQIGSVFNIYNGDVNQDGVIDLSDGSLIDNDAFNFSSGYLNTDLTGDDIVDLSDVSIADNNANNFVSVITP